ncbi:MAG: hypothetical protein COB20_15290 [SAR86 cluster bacterium]|uniref:Uncharacterized protein n=1 Tax=SAR86 cluster bacterium TaxID=2030880 RepID=A0A2A4WV41_9GAMM|nr:MAG: hypothetical protein COB20_15290 [SAR86 cluster bacterium]
MLAMLTSCSEEEDVFVPSNIVSAPFTALSIDEVRTHEKLRSIPIDEVRTYDELEFFLREKYGDIQSLDSIWMSLGNGDSSSGPFRFRLSDGSEISVDGFYNRTSGQIIDPNFDLRLLPDVVIN